MQHIVAPIPYVRFKHRWHVAIHISHLADHTILYARTHCGATVSPDEHRKKVLIFQSEEWPPTLPPEITKLGLRKARLCHICVPQIKRTLGVKDDNGSVPKATRQLENQNPASSN